ncbi:MAG: hypothetical protein LUG18_11605 [Candidatus Azobacteroides sp.]|nr:hypothetical protein [Candidatus Azobacteroides sp.]
MKLISKIGFFIVSCGLFCSMFFTSCSDDDDTVYTLYINKKRLTFTQAASDTTLTISSSSKWKTVQSFDWITCDPSLAGGSGDMTVYVAPNTSSQGRTGYIPVSNADGRRDTIQVMQTGTTPMIYLSQYSASVSRTKTSVSVAVASNVGDFTLSTENAWITLPKISSGDNYCTFTISANAYEEREGKVIFKQVNGDVTAELVITQAESTSDLEHGKDSLALVAFYEALFGEEWVRKWLLSEPLTSWYGVELTDNRITGLSLNNNNLRGSIPEEILQLSELKYLILEGNELTGQLPSGLSELENLEILNLSKNQYEGAMPSVIAALSSLKKLNLSYNNYTSLIDFSNLTALEEVIITDNPNLSVSIPSSIGKLEAVRTVHFNNNNLSGSIPVEVKSMKALQDLKLFSNNLSGSIPSEIGEVTSLVTADLQDNKFTGSIPSSVGNLKNLKELMLNDNELSGSISSSIGNMSALETLLLQDNNLTGEIPSDIGNLTNLTALYIYNNDLSGSIPAELGRIAALRLLNLTNNQLSGEIPETLLNHSNWSWFEVCSQRGTGFTNCP